MNFICSISHTLIKKNDRVRIFFLESHSDPSFPFMNYNQPTSVGNFSPLGCAHKAKFEDDEHNEYFTFNIDGEASPLVTALLKDINDRLLTKSEAEENNLLSHNSQDMPWGKISSLEELFHRCRDQSVYLKKNNNDQFPFVSVMIIHESAYKLMLEHSNMNAVLERYNKNTEDKKYLENQAFVARFTKDRLDEVTALKGKMHKHTFLEEVLLDEELFNQSIKDVEYLKDSDNQEDIDVYHKAVEDFREKIGTYQELNIHKERFVDDDYVKRYMDDVRKDMLMNNNEEKALKKAAHNANSDNFIASKQIDQIKIEEKWKKSEWLPILEAYVIEFFLTYSGYEFLPSRRHYQYQHLENKAFFQDLVQLKVYR